MDIFHIEGPVCLSGDVDINGSKNASLPIMAATILAPGKSVLKSIPYLSDISVCGELLTQLGCKLTREQNGDLCIDSTVIDNPVGDYEIVRRMRAGICILGPLLARCGRAEVSMPGGCAIGIRPIDIHLRGLQELGAQIRLKSGYIIAEAPNGLTGKDIFMGGPFGSTVLGTANVLMAATLAKGRTVIESAACEPEIADLANCLNQMGAKMSGIGSPRLIIDGVKQLQPVQYEVIPDRIEAGTFMVAAAITSGQLRLLNCRLEDMMAVVDRLRNIGETVDADGDGFCTVTRTGPARTNATEALRSEAITGAAINFFTPATITACPSLRKFAAIRFNSATCINLSGNTLSMTILFPSASDKSAINWACKSVGKPGYG